MIKTINVKCLAIMLLSYYTENLKLLSLLTLAPTDSLYARSVLRLSTCMGDNKRALKFLRVDP